MSDDYNGAPEWLDWISRERDGAVMGFGIGVLGRRRIPAGEELLQVALEQRQQIVLRVILVVIGDAGEVEGHGLGKGSEGGERTR